MANLVKCKDCGKKVSVDAQNCPKCGAPVQPSVEKHNEQQAKGKKALGYIIGGVGVLMSLGALSDSFFAGVILLIGSVLAFPFIRKMIIEKKPNISNQVLKILSGILIVLGFVLSSSSSESESKVTATDSSEPDVSSPKDYSDVVYEYTEKEYPKAYEEWGEDWINKINQSMLPAVQTIAKEKKCDEPEVMAISENESVIQEKAVLFVDCSNKNRFFIDINDAVTGENIYTQKDVDEKIRDAQSVRLDKCLTVIRNSLKNPRSFDLESGSIKHGVDSDSGNDITGFKFYAQNGFGAEIIHQAICIFDKDGKMIDYGVE